MYTKRFLGLLLVLAGGLAAQSVETIPFRAVLLPSNEVPPIDIAASGAATVWLHVVRDATGQIVSGSADFDVSYAFPGAISLTGLHIHSGAAGVNGPVTVNSGIVGSNPINNDTGRGSIKLQGQATNAAALDTIRGMLENPANYYVNLHSTVNPGGVIRGQLHRAEMVVLMGMMGPQNEVPPVTTTNASAVGSVVALAARDASGRLMSGQVIFDVNYTGFAEDARFTGFHIHPGAAGVNGPVSINTGLQQNTPVGAGGAGSLHFEVEVPMTSAAAVSTLEGLFRNPQNYYINLHTVSNPGGIIRAQLRNTDALRFPVTMLPSNEVPPIAGLEARSEGAFTAHTIRDSEGNVIAAVAIFDVNPRFPGETAFTGLHIHNGAAGVNGPVRVDSGIQAANAVTSTSGSMNIYRMATINSANGLATLNSILSNPELHYINLHTSVNPGGAVRAQLAPAVTAPPAVTAIISSISDANVRTVAPGGLMSIFGTNLTKVPGGLSSSEGSTVRTSLNGVQVSIGGRNAPIIVLEPGVIVAQVPVETDVGMRPVVVTTPNGPSTPVQATVAASAPAIFYDGVGGVIVKNDTFQLVRPNNPARAGDILVIYATGLGAVSGVGTGQIPPSNPLSNTSPATVTIGGRDAEVIYSLVSPGFLGLYQTAVRVPSGVAAGNAPVVLRTGNTSSNSVNIAVQ